MTLEGIQRVVVLGLARTGEAVARDLLGRGMKVTVLDAADDDAVRARAATLDGAHVLLGRMDGSDVDGADVVIASPGIRPDSAWHRAAEEAGIAIWSEVELAYRLGVTPLVAITGTNGKTTTTEMVAAILRADGREAVAAGNIGTPLIGARGNAIVAEVSSFQLQHAQTFRAPVGVLLNIGADHLDWHGSFRAYKEAKSRLFENMQPADLAVVHADPECDQLIAETSARVVRFHGGGRPIGGAGIEDEQIVVPQGPVMPVAQLAAQGRPFRSDAVAAAAATAALGVGLETIAQALAAFAPSAHRMEQLGEIDGVRYVNDSKATDPHATLAALEEMRDVVLIAGGRNKGLDLGELADAAWALRAVVAIGEAAGEIVEAFEGSDVPVTRARTMDEAVEQARAAAQPGDTVLLSPACASFDMFGDYAERGEAFRDAVRRLGGSTA